MFLRSSINQSIEYKTINNDSLDFICFRFFNHHDYSEIYKDNYDKLSSLNLFSLPENITLIINIAGVSDDLY